MPQSEVADIVTELIQHLSDSVNKNWTSLMS